MCTVFFKLRVWSSPLARSTGPWAVTLFLSVFLSCGSRKRDTRRWPAWPRLGPACRSPYLQLISESLGPAVRPGAEAAGNETPDADLAPARICFGRTRRRGRGPGTGETGTRRPASHPTRPSHSALLTGPAGQASGQHCRGPDRIAAHRVAEPGPGQRRPSGQLDVSSRQACGSRPPPP